MGDGAVVVVLSGDRRVDIGKVGKMVGGQVRVATPNEVRVSTGYPVGGVPPFPHWREVRVMVDASLMRFASVWAAAGAPNAVFRISPWELVGLVGLASNLYQKWDSNHKAKGLNRKGLVKYPRPKFRPRPMADTGFGPG